MHKQNKCICRTLYSRYQCCFENKYFTFILTYRKYLKQNEKMKTVSLHILLAVFACSSAFTQVSIFPLADTKGLRPIDVKLTADTYKGKKSVRLTDTVSNRTGPSQNFARLLNLPFHNGIIEVELEGKPLPTAGAQARGFVGIAFRITEDNSKFECIYLRPTNGRAEDQVRRNHSVQYSSHPDFPFSVSRKVAPEKYESYVDLVPGEWTKVKIEVQGEKARLYVHGSLQPVLIVNDLKLGADQQGAIGLLIGPGTDAHFANLKVTRE
jgi:hypothetical protein